MQQLVHAKAMDSRWSWFHKIGGAAALLTGLLLLLGLFSLIASLVQPGATNDWLLIFQNNWLVKIFIVHAEFSGVQGDLHGLNLLDILVLLLASIVCLGLSATFRKTSKTWSLIAFALSLIAIVLFVITQIAGRSTVMLAVLINSLVMFQDRVVSKATVYTGILASIFLFVGDLTVGIHSNLITVLFAVGYVLLTIWFFLIAQYLFRPGRV